MNENKIYSITAIGVATFLGGPLAGYYLLSKNYETLNNKDAADKMLTTGVIVTLSMLLILSLLTFIPNYLISIIFIILLTNHANKNQAEGIEKVLASGGSKYSGWNVFGVIIITGLLTIAAAVIMGLVATLIFS